METLTVYLNDSPIGNLDDENGDGKIAEGIKRRIGQIG